MFPSANASPRKGPNINKETVTETRNLLANVNHFTGTYDDGTPINYLSINQHMDLTPEETAQFDIHENADNGTISIGFRSTGLGCSVNNNLFMSAEQYKAFRAFIAFTAPVPDKIIVESVA